MKFLILAICATSCATNHYPKEVMTPIDGLLSSCSTSQKFKLPGYQNIICTFENQSQIPTQFQLSHIQLTTNDISQGDSTDSMDGEIRILNEAIQVPSSYSVTRSFLVETSEPLVELSMCFKQYTDCSTMNLKKPGK